MKIFVKAKPKSKKEFVKKIDATHYIVAVKEPPVNNKANEAIVKLLGSYFNVSPSLVIIASGHTARQKIVEVPFAIEDLEKIGEPKQVQAKMF